MSPNAQAVVRCKNFVPGANLSGCDLRGVDLTGLNLTHANLFRARLKGATLDNATLTKALVGGAGFAGADLAGVVSGAVSGVPATLPDDWILVNGYLVGPGANLTAANLTGANLSFSHLAGANLSKAKLARANLFGVRSGSITTTPSSPPSNWSSRRATSWRPRLQPHRRDAARPGPPRRLSSTPTSRARRSRTPTCAARTWRSRSRSAPGSTARGSPGEPLPGRPDRRRPRAGHLGGRPQGAVAARRLARTHVLLGAADLSVRAFGARP